MNEVNPTPTSILLIHDLYFISISFIYILKVQESSLDNGHMEAFMKAFLS
jgi:hypothetical protein